MKLLDKAEIIHNVSGHPFLIHEQVTIFRVLPNDKYDVCNKKGDCWVVNALEIFKIDTPMVQMTQAVIDTANRLLKAQNEVTTLEIKAEVIKTHPNYFWTQNFVSAVMDDAYKAGMYTYYDTSTGGNTHRVYSGTGVKIRNVKQKQMKTATVVATKTKKATKKAVTKTAKKTAPIAVANRTISKTKALELMENNKGHFFTATFIDKKNKERTMNCQYLKDQTYSKLGYVKVREAIKAKMKPEDAIRQVNLQTLKALRIAGNSYKVK